MIKKFHEAPLSIFKMVQQYTQGDYALAHLMDNPWYRDTFREAVYQGREVILDNSLYELGKAFNGDQYVDIINSLNPTWFIVPDCWHNGPETMKMFDQFIDKYGVKVNPSVKWIGVAQGASISEIAKCYQHIVKYCDMIAFNFDCSRIFRNATGFNGDPREAMSYGRMMLMQELDSMGVIDISKPHHLLGCGIPREYQIAKRYPWIYSMDTCHPVITGYAGLKYNGNVDFNIKSNVKMESIMFEEVTETQFENILSNLEDRVWQ